MNSKRLPSVNKTEAPAYRRNQAKNLTFLAGVSILLVIAFLLSLRAGSYNTPTLELVKGILGRAEDARINLVVQSNVGLSFFRLYVHKC